MIFRSYYASFQSLENWIQLFFSYLHNMFSHQEKTKYEIFEKNIMYIQKHILQYF